MKEHEDRMMPSIQKSIVTVGSTAVDELVTGRLGGGEGKTEGFLAERDAREDVVVDVVGDDVIDGDHGRTEVDLDGKKGSLQLVEACIQKEAETHDLDMKEVAGSGEEVCHASVGCRVLNLLEVEVTMNEEGLEKSVESSKYFLQGNVTYGSDGDDQKSGTWVRDSKMTSASSNGEPQVVGDIDVIDGRELTGRATTEEVMEQHVESVEEVADGDCVMDEKTRKENEVLDSLKVAESETANLGSQEVDMVVVEEGFTSKDEASVSVGPSIVCANNNFFLTELANARTGEIVGKSKEEHLHPTIKAITDDAQGNGIVEPLSTEPHPIRGKNDLMDREEELKRGLAKVMEQAMECDQQVAGGDSVVNKKVRKEFEALDSSKISEPSTATTNDSEAVGAVALEEGLASKDEAQDGVSVDQSFVCPDIRDVSTKVVNSATGEGDVSVKAENLDQQAEVNNMSKKESSLLAIEVITNDGHTPENGTGMGESKPALESSSGEPQFGGETALIDKEDTEGGLTKDKVIVEQPIESVQEVTNGEGVIDEKTGKGDEVLDSSEILELEVTVNLGAEVLARKVEAQNSDSVDLRSVFADNRSLLNEVVSAGTGQGSVRVNAENSDQHVEVDSMSKDKSMHPTIAVEEVTACTEVDELTTASDIPNCEAQVTSAGGMSSLVENQRSKVNAVLDSSRPDVAACTEAESSIDQTTTATASKVKEIDPEGQNCKVDVEDQGLKTEAVRGGSIVDAVVCAKPSNNQFLFNSGNEVPTMDIMISNPMVEVPSIGEMNCFQVSADTFEEVNSVTPGGDVAKHCVLPEDLDVSNKGVHLERGEDAGMDIDKVLGWKDKTLRIDVLSGSAGQPGKDQNCKIKANSEGDVEQGVLIGQREEIYKSRQPIVYERRPHVEVPLYDALDERRSPLSEDENLKVETDSEEDDESLQEEGQKVVGFSTNLPQADGLVNEEASALEPLDTVSGGDHPRDANVDEVKDSSVADKEYHSLPFGKDSQLVENSAHLHACLDDRGDDGSTEAGLLMGMEVDVKEHSVIREQTIFCREHKAEALDHGSEAEQATGKEINKSLDNESSFSLHQLCYFRPPERGGQFSVSDLVWGKIRSHPWWPGQIFRPSDASDKAMKYHKKNCFLVAYFGDGTFAWNDSAVLKPFRANFSQIEKNSNLEAFKNAVRCALEEVSRRVELGLACSCVPWDIYEKIKYQIVENGGIRKKSNRRHGTDKSASVGSFEPDKLMDYVRLLAQFAGEGDKMELTIAKAQLSSYGRYKGYRQLTEFQVCGDILEDETMLCEGVEQVNKHGAKITERRNSPGECNASQKFENNLMDSAYPNKGRSLSDLTEAAPNSGDGDGAEGNNINSNLVSNSGSKKRKALDSNLVYNSGSKKRKALDGNLVSKSGFKKRKALDRPSVRSHKVPTALISTPKPSFKVGECIQRVASQLTGPPSALKSNSDPKVEQGQHADQVVGSAVSLQIPEDSQRRRIMIEGKQSSVAEMLSQLHLTAQDPMKGYSFLNTIIPFFYERRAAVFSKSIRKSSCIEIPVNASKRKASVENDPEEFEFEFDDVDDSYWTDKIIQNHSEEQLFQDNQNGGLEHHIVASEPDKPAKASRRSYKKRERVSSSNHETEAKEQSELVEQRRQNLATEVVLKFAEGIYFPSEIHLNKMFRRFGPLMESETEVDRQSGRARVVFKKCSDAEVAHSSAEKFNIFGSITVNYELNYTPLVSYKPLPPLILQDPTDAS